MEQLLQTLPTKIYGFYERILLAIPETLFGMIRRMLSWLVVSRRAVTLQELEETLSITDHTLSLQAPAQIFMGVLLQACGSLLRHHKGTGVVSISHFTVKVRRSSSFLARDKWN